MQGSEWLVPQVALLHAWAGEEQCRVNPLQRYYLSHTHRALIIIIIIIIVVVVVVVVVFKGEARIKHFQISV